MAWAPGEGGGGGPEMGFRTGPFVLWKDGCCHQRRRNTNFDLDFFSRKNFPPHMCSQNDQRDVGIILSHVCWGRTPRPGTAGRAAPAQAPLPARRPRRGRGGLGKWASVPSPPRKAIFFPPRAKRPALGARAAHTMPLRRPAQCAASRLLFPCRSAALRQGHGRAPAPSLFGQDPEPGHGGLGHAAAGRADAGALRWTPVALMSPLISNLKGPPGASPLLQYPAPVAVPLCWSGVQGCQGCHSTPPRRPVAFDNSHQIQTQPPPNPPPMPPAWAHLASGEGI